MERTKPFLKWAGGKYRCLNHVISALPPGSRLVEPFTGSGAVFLNAPHEHFLLAEANADLVALYNHLKQEGVRFIRYCKHLFCKANNQSDTYYQYRVQFNQSKPGSRKRAALFLYLNRHGYNGLCRYNLSGQYNVPFGRYVKPYFPQQELETFYQKCQTAEFIKADFKETFLNLKSGDVIYCDPPYAPLSKTSQFTAYTRQKFGEAEQISLATLAKDTAKNGIPVIISNHDTPFTRDLYHGANIISFPVRRNISCKGNRRLFVHELIAVFS
ncbi:MAG: Dam family site-specific DNA-(adenine-N6)-methyltransferase [Gammaproteobacteria bacterium]|nr:Dam family site-specific DNA-(adenine-N6)-methyltransferase [Gammaproteobacteria bacterium]